MRLVAGEVLKLRRRWASYIVLAVLIGIMGLVFILTGMVGRGAGLTLRFPATYGVINEFVFGLGSLLAVAYAAAIAGADWSWGILGVVVARGESRSRYILAKAAGLAIALGVGVVLAYLAGIVLSFLAAAMAGIPAGEPLAGSGSGDLGRSVGLGYLVLLERAAIGFAVALVLRSQMAGVIVGIVLYIGEAILTGILTVAGIAGSAFLDPERIQRGPEWFQYLPFSIGESVMSAAVASPATTDPDVAQFLLRPVPIEQAIVATAAYLGVALIAGMLSVERAQLTGSAG